MMVRPDGLSFHWKPFYNGDVDRRNISENTMCPTGYIALQQHFTRGRRCWTPS